MKIEIKRIIGGLFVIGFIALNLVLNSASEGNNEPFSLKNLEALQSSALEVYCDQRDASTCTIKVSGTIVGTSTGAYVIQN